METYRLIIPPHVFTELKAIYDFIAKDSTNYAADMVGRILDALEKLKLAPNHNVVDRDESRGKVPIRSLPVLPYVVYYEVLEADKVVHVLHVRHGARRPPGRRR